MVAAKFLEAVSIPTLIGSVLSSLAAAAVLISYAILPIKRHFRHALIINLAVAGIYFSLQLTALEDRLEDRLESGLRESTGGLSSADDLWLQISSMLPIMPFPALSSFPLELHYTSAQSVRSMDGSANLRCKYVDSTSNTYSGRA